MKTLFQNGTSGCVLALSEKRFLIKLLPRIAIALVGRAPRITF